MALTSNEMYVLRSRLSDVADGSEADRIVGRLALTVEQIATDRAERMLADVEQQFETLIPDLPERANRSRPGTTPSSFNSSAPPPTQAQREPNPKEGPEPESNSVRYAPIGSRVVDDRGRGRILVWKL